MNRQFENFDLEFSRAAEGYTARVLSSPGGEGSQSFAIPVNSLELENVVLQVLAARHVRSIASKQGSRLRGVGGALFKAVFAGEILQCYLRSLAGCTEASGLRIRLRFVDTPELVNLPWELLYDEGIDQWVALKLDTPLVRYLRMPTQIAPLRVSGPLHVLTVVSDPSDVPHLDIDSEAAAVEGALRLLDESSPGSVVAQTLRHPTPELLQRKLMELPWHVLHFIGHGEFDERTGTGMLVLEDEKGKARPITAERLSVMLQGRSLKLVILNSCEGSRGGEDHRSGLAQSLIAQGVPAVIAMQFPITDTAALAFSRMFYHAVVLGTSLENAVVEARRAIFQESELEWATPTLYLRSENGLLFERFDSAGLRKVVSAQQPRSDAPADPSHVDVASRELAGPEIAKPEVAKVEVAKVESAAEEVTPESAKCELAKLEVAKPEPDPHPKPFVEPVPPVPIPWWKRRFALAGAVFGMAGIALAVTRLAPVGSPQPSPSATELVAATVAPTLGTLAPILATAPPTAATLAPSTAVPNLAALARDRPTTAEILRSLAGMHLATLRPVLLSPTPAPALTSFGTTCPMTGATVRDLFLTNTHGWDPMPSDATIAAGSLTVELGRNQAQPVAHDGSLRNGTVCTTLYGLSASGLANPAGSGAGLLFWENAYQYWVFYVTPAREFRVMHYDVNRRLWAEKSAVPLTYSPQIRLVGVSSPIRPTGVSPFSGTELLDLVVNENVLTVRLAGSNASFYINGANVGHASGGPAGPTWSGVFAQTGASESKEIGWRFSDYGVAP